MAVFEADKNKKFEEFTQDVESIITDISGHARKEDVSNLERLVDNFNRKTADFYRENRNLNIGVVGQVKAGKSSFLNTLLFGGQEILPKAATPKTAALTKMEYAERNRIVIEYYSEDEWEDIRDNSLVQSDDERYTSAREIMEMVNRNAYDPLPYLNKGSEIIEFDSYEKLLNKLNDYVGENGKFTPIVKAVTLYTNKEEFKGLSIVDTPGLNDPIASRTLRTKEFIEYCDVVFFLSQSGSFLDKSDWTLLSTQLPQKGVKRLILIASKYDSAIRDILRQPDEDNPFEVQDDNTADNIPDACRIARRVLTGHAKNNVRQFINELQKNDITGSSQKLVNVIQQCEQPVMISALAQNMAGKPQSEYTPEEKNLYYALKQFSGNMDADLRALGNFEEVNELFNEVIRDKKLIMEEKSRDFVPNANEELKNYLLAFKDKANKRIHILETNDRQRLLDEKNRIEGQMNKTKADVYDVFGDRITQLKKEKMDALQSLREANKKYSGLKERTGSKIVTSSHWVSNSKWWNPFSWGKGHNEASTKEVHYSYCAVSDAIDNLNNYMMDTSNNVEKVFTNVISIKAIKRELLNTVINNFNMGSEKFDSALIRTIVQETIEEIDFPTFHMDIENEKQEIFGKFSGELTTSDEKMKLSNALTAALARIFERVCLETDRTVDDYIGKMKDIRDQFQSKLLSDITDEFESLVSQCDNKDREIASYREYVRILDGIIVKRYPGIEK